MWVKVSQLYGGVHDCEAELVTSFHFSGIDSIATHYAILLAGEGRTPEEMEGAR